MNQILVTQKVYVTPEIKRKKNFFKIEFILSVFLLCIFSSYAIYAEYDRNKSEEVSQELLSQIEYKDTTVVKEESVIMIVLNSAFDEEINTSQLEQTTTIIEQIEADPEQKTIASDGTAYFTIGTVNIPSIGINYPILSETTDVLLKIAPCKFWGCNPNEVGNFCIVGHNYRNTKFFSKVPSLENGDIIEITDLSGRTIQYSVYDKYTVSPSDTNCTSQITEGRKDITLITCTNDCKQRYIIKATAVLTEEY